MKLIQKIKLAFYQSRADYYLKRYDYDRYGKWNVKRQEIMLEDMRRKNNESIK